MTELVLCASLVFYILLGGKNKIKLAWSWVTSALTVLRLMCVMTWCALNIQLSNCLLFMYLDNGIFIWKCCSIHSSPWNSFHYCTGESLLSISLSDLGGAEHYGELPCSGSRNLTRLFCSCSSKLLTVDNTPTLTNLLRWTACQIRV